MENVSRGIFSAMENTIVKVMSFLFYNKKIQKSYRPTLENIWMYINVFLKNRIRDDVE